MLRAEPDHGHERQHIQHTGSSIHRAKTRILSVSKTLVPTFLPGDNHRTYSLPRHAIAKVSLLPVDETPTPYVKPQHSFGEIPLSYGAPTRLSRLFAAPGRLAFDLHFAVVQRRWRDWDGAH